MTVSTSLKTCFLGVFLTLLLPYVTLAQVDSATLKAQLEVANGKERALILLDAAESIGERDAEQAVQWATEALEIAQVLNDAELVSESRVALGRANFRATEYQTALQELRLAEAACEESGSFELLTKAYLYQGLSHNLLAHYDSAETAFENSLALCRKINYRIGEGEALSNMGTNARYRADYDQSAAYHFEALQVYEALGDSNKIADQFSSIGIIYYYQQQNEKAYEQFQKCQQWYEAQHDTGGLGFAQTLLALAAFRLGRHEESIEHSLLSFELREALNDVRGMGESLNNLSLAYMALGNWQEAFDTQERALRLLTEAQDLRQRPIILANMGYSTFKLGKAAEALGYYHQSLQHALEDGNKSSVLQAYLRMHEAFASTQQYDSAYHYRCLHANMNDSLFTEEKNRTIDELSIKYESAQKEHENVLLKQESATRAQEQLVLAISLGTGVVILLLVVLLLSQRIRRNQQVFAAQQELTEAKLVNAQQELDHHRTKLNDYTHNLLEKNRMLEEMQAQLASAANNQAAPEKTMPNLLEMKILTDDDWADFKRLFENVHTGFHARLRERYNDLSEGEQRLFLLLRLNLNTKEIANILGVAVDSVKKARYRLRKKLSLQEAENLQDFVSSF